MGRNQDGNELWRQLMLWLPRTDPLNSGNLLLPERLTRPVTNPYCPLILGNSMIQRVPTSPGYEIKRLWNLTRNGSSSLTPTTNSVPITYEPCLKPRGTFDSLLRWEYILMDMKTITRSSFLPTQVGFLSVTT